MSITLVYVGAAAGVAPAASLRALSGGGAASSGAAAPVRPPVYVPAGLDGELRELVAEAADPGFGRLLELDPADGEGLDDLVRSASGADVVVALAGPGGPQLARELRARLAGAIATPAAAADSSATPAPELVTVPAGQAFDDALLGQELVSLKRIVDVLRVECPWDREQTPRDIIGYTVEETHELADAVAAGDLSAEHGELGDLLLQVVLLSLMLSEVGAGDLASVAHDIEVKLIRRHPHIFADAVAETPKDVKDRWERIKVEQEGRQGIFHDVPAGFPALLYAKKLQQRAASVGFDWDSASEAFPKIAEEHAELAELFREAAEAEAAAAAVATADTAPAAAAPERPAAPSGRPAELADPHRADPRVAHEVGDLLFATVNVARLLKVDPELALREAGRRFERRVTSAAELAAAAGEDWSSLDLQAQEAYYQRAKSGERPD
jgi:MazG family protein